MSSSQMCASQLRFSSSAWLTSQKCAVFGCFRSTAFIDVGCTSKKLSKFLHSSNNTNLKSRCSVFSIFKHDLPRNIGWINSSSYRALHEMGLSDKPRGKINSPFVFWRSFTDTDIKGKYSEEQLEKQFETVASLEPEVRKI